MLTWNDLYIKIGNSSKEFLSLQKKFNEYFIHIEKQLDEPLHKSHGIHVQKIDDAIFTSSFAGRNLTFVLTTTLNGSGKLTGRVTCYMECKFPEEKFILIDSFDFSTSGETSLSIEDSDNDPAQMDYDIHAIRIFLEFLYKSLSY